LTKPNEELKGRVFEFGWSTRDPDNPFMYVEIETESGDIVKCKGNELPQDWDVDQDYILYGKWKKNTKPGYEGLEFEFQAKCIVQPVTEEAVVRYLQRAPAIGPAKALLLWNRWGEHTLSCIGAAPASQVAYEGEITEEQAVIVKNFFHNIERTQRTDLALTSLFAGRNLPKRLPNLCKEVWGIKAPEVIQTNPFELMMFSGVGFLKCDNLWEYYGKPKDSDIRAAWCAYHAVDSVRDGSTWVTRPQMFNQVSRLIGSPGPDRALRAIELAIEEGLVIRTTGKDGKEWFATKRQGEHEQELALAICRATDEIDDEMGCPRPSAVRWPDVDLVEGISDHQREQLRRATSGTVGILTGGPGTGKTHTVARFLKMLDLRSTCICAPTGKAAVRSSEAAQEAGLRIVAKTIHSTLVVSSHSLGDGWGFNYNGENPLPYRYIIVDESPMIGTSLMRHLAIARGYGSHILFVGDPHQLPPVGHGRPYLDLITAGLPQGHLTEPQRNSGDIVLFCHAIAEGRGGDFPLARKLDLDKGHNLVMEDCRSPGGMKDRLNWWLEEAARHGFDPIKDLQVITPTNKDSEFARVELNMVLQNILNNDPDAGHENWKFRVGDKVICLENGFYKQDDQEGDIYVANGEQGYVVELTDSACIVEMTFPDRLMKFTKKDKIELAYAITCHKAQGSEWPVGIVIINPKAKHSYNREWVTTACSRFKVFGACIGPEQILRRGLAKTGIADRRTNLPGQINRYRRELWEIAHGKREHQETPQGEDALHDRYRSTRGSAMAVPGAQDFDNAF